MNSTKDGYENRVVVLSQEPLSVPFVACLREGNDWQFEFESPTDFDWKPPTKTSLVVAIDHYSQPAVSILGRLVSEQRSPVLLLADGILEYRNTFSHPTLAPGAIYQPLFAHKLACLGRAQARLIESWGNLGKCEVVGAPRFDRLLGRKPRERKPGEPFTVLVMTAKSPGFDERQMEITRRSLADLKRWFDEHAVINGVPVRPRWRITMGLDEQIGVPNELRDTTGQDLAAALNEVDAVFTTPSTAMLEGMLQGVPVALLDYHNCPHYVPAAWTISAAEHIDGVMQELLHPPAAKILWQQTILHDNLECRTPATPRMVELAEAMIRIGHDCAARGEPLKFPHRILADEQDGHHLPEESFDMQRLYPDHPVFGNPDRWALQAQVGQLQLRVAQLEAERESLLKEGERMRTAPRVPLHDLRYRFWQWRRRAAAICLGKDRTRSKS